MIPTDIIFLFIIRVVVFFMIRVDPSPILFYFYFFYSIRVGPSRSELIRPGLEVRVDPVRLLYLPVGDVKIVSQISTFVLNTQPMYLATQIKWFFFSGDCSVDCWMGMCDVFASKVIQVHPNVNVRFHVSFLLSLCCCANIFHL